MKIQSVYINPAIATRTNFNNKAVSGSVELQRNNALSFKHNEIDTIVESIARGTVSGDIKLPIKSVYENLFAILGKNNIEVVMKGLADKKTFAIEFTRSFTDRPVIVEKFSLEEAQKELGNSRLNYGNVLGYLTGFDVLSLWSGYLNKSVAKVIEKIPNYQFERIEKTKIPINDFVLTKDRIHPEVREMLDSKYKCIIDALKRKGITLDYGMTGTSNELTVLISDTKTKTYLADDAFNKYKHQEENDINIAYLRCLEAFDNALAKLLNKLPENAFNSI